MYVKRDPDFLTVELLYRQSLQEHQWYFTIVLLDMLKHQKPPLLCFQYGDLAAWPLPGKFIEWMPFRGYFIREAWPGRRSEAADERPNNCPVKANT
jgi:hypothetical protein